MKLSMISNSICLRVKRFSISFLVLLIGFQLSACANFGQKMKSLIDGGDTKTQSAGDEAGSSEKKPVRYSENQNLYVPQDKQYRRMTREKMEAESDLGARAGSMWVMDGQGAYLFAQNKTRKEGDLVNIKIEGPSQRQIETKVSVIRKLIQQLEEEKQQAIKNQSVAENKDGAAKREPAAATPPPAPAKEEKQDLSELQTVPTRIVERQADGNYRIKGSQPFMIGQREYKVIVTGIVRPEDFNDEGMSANKLLDPQFDVVSLRRSKAE